MGFRTEIISSPGTAPGSSPPLSSILSSLMGIQLPLRGSVQATAESTLGMKEWTVLPYSHVVDTTLVFSQLQLPTARLTWSMVTTDLLSVYYAHLDWLSLSSLQILQATCFRIPNLSEIPEKALWEFPVTILVSSCLYLLILPGSVGAVTDKTTGLILTLHHICSKPNPCALEVFFDLCQFSYILPM